jgi:DHA3 family tetracycline resistance protein-like MFS transporter
VSRRTAGRLPARTAYLLIETADGFLFTLMGTVFSLYVIVDADLDPFRLLMLGTVLELTILVFEVPTGVVADTVSRRLSVIVGFGLTAVGFAVTGLVPEFAWIVVGQALWGLGHTFVSGAEEAWITDEVGEKQAAALYLRGAQAWQAGALVGIAGAVGLGALGLGVPLVAAGIGYGILALALAWLMPETNFHRARDGERRRFVRTFTDGIRAVRRSHVLVLVLLVAALHGMATEGFDRLSQLHLLEGTSFPSVGRLGLVAVFGLIEAVGLGLSIVAAQILRRRADLASYAVTTRVLAGIDVALVVSVVAFGLLDWFWLALSAFWIVAFLREVRQPVFTAWLNRGLEPATRATVNSMGGQMDAIGQVAGGPTIGAVAVAWGVPAAIVIGGVLRAPALVLYGRALRRGEPTAAGPVHVDIPAELEVPGMPNPE